MQYILVIHREDDGGFWAEVPAPAAMRRETCWKMCWRPRDAIVSHVEALREDGQSVPPEASAVVATVTVPGEAA